MKLQKKRGKNSFFNVLTTCDICGKEKPFVNKLPDGLLYCYTCYNKTDNIFKTCAFCGKQDSTVTERTDPYASDVNGDDTLYNICDTCHSDKEDDI